MRDLDKMLNDMKEEDKEFEREVDDLNELEKRRIFDLTMKKINALERGEGTEDLEEIEKDIKPQDFEGETVENLSKHKHKKRIVKISKEIVKVAAAIVIIVVAGGSAIAGLGLDSSIKNYFGIHDTKTKKKVEKLVTAVDQTVKSGGVAVTVRQVIGDNTGFYAVLEAKDAPYCDETLAFKEDDVEVAGIPKSQSVSWMSPQQGGVDSDTGITTFTMKVNTKNICGKNISLHLKNLGYYNDVNKFKTLVKGTWDFEWKLSYENESKNIKVGKDINLLGDKGVWKSIVLTPLSVTVKYSVKHTTGDRLSEEEYLKYDGTDRLVVQYMDGSRLDSRFAEYADDLTDESGVQETLSFKKVVDTSDIESISFAGQTVVINKNKKHIERERYTSKAANCTVDLPVKMCDKVWVKEESDGYNDNLKCKEKSAAFWGEKNGCKMMMFSIQRLKGMYSEEDLEEKEPFMTYVGYRRGYTYTITYGEIVDEDQLKNFPDLMNQYISNVLPYFEYLK